MFLAAVGDGIDPLFNPFFVDVDDEFQTQLLGHIIIPHGVHLPEFPGGVDMHQREGGLGGVEGLEGQVDHAGRVLADAVEHDRVFELRHHLADDMDALGFQLLEMGEGVAGHQAGRGIRECIGLGVAFWVVEIGQYKS